MKQSVKTYLEDMLKNNLFAVIYPKEKTEEAAKKIASEVDFAVGIASFEDECGDSQWGVLIDKVKAAQRYPNIVKNQREVVGNDDGKL